MSPVQLDRPAGRSLTRRAVLGKALGLGTAVAVAAVLGPIATSAEHTSQPYTVTADLNLRSGPGTRYPVILVMPKGATVTMNQRYENGFYSVTYNGTNGWAHGDYIVPGGGPIKPTDPVVVGNARTTDAVNLRSGPSTGHQVLRVVPAGTWVGASGTVQNGLRYVVYQGLGGWIFDQYLAWTDGPPGDATTTSALNLRAEASTSAKVLLVMPSGARVLVLDGYANGFRKVSYNGTIGWAYAAYLN